jgi:translation elongation factor EF-G
MCSYSDTHPFGNCFKRSVIDLVKMKAYYFECDNGEYIKEDEIPEELAGQAKEKRVSLLRSWLNLMTN